MCSLPLSLILKLKKMLLPVRCFTCNKPLHHSYDTFLRLSKERGKHNALDTMGLRRICCRTVYLSHVPIIDELIKYPDVRR